MRAYPEIPKHEALTPEQLKLCDQLGITAEEFREERDKLAVANLI